MITTEYISESDIIKVMQGVVDNYLIPKFKALGLNASGQWLSSLEVTAVADRGIIRGEPYTRQLVDGRSPGTLPPVDQIEKWVNVKLGITGERGRNVAWAISQKIKKEGTEIYKDGGTDLIEVLYSRECLDYIAQQFQPIIIQNIRSEFSKYTRSKFKR